MKPERLRDNKKLLVNQEANKDKAYKFSKNLTENHLEMRVCDLIKKYGKLTTKKIIEKEIHLFKNSLKTLDFSEAYKAMNGYEKEVLDYTYKNKNEVLKNSMYEYIGIGDIMLS